MRAKWRKDAYDVEHLEMHTSKGWIYMGWVEPTIGGFNALACWISNGDYPENKIFETAKQARRALKATATVAIIGGFRGLHE